MGSTLPSLLDNGQRIFRENEHVWPSALVYPLKFSGLWLGVSGGRQGFMWGLPGRGGSLRNCFNLQAWLPRLCISSYLGPATGYHNIHPHLLSMYCMLASHNLITPSDHAPIDEKAGSKRSGLLPKMMQMVPGGTGRGPGSTHFPRQVQCIVKLCLPISATHTPAPGWKGRNLEKSPTSHHQGSQEPKHFSAVKCQ